MKVRVRVGMAVRVKVSVFVGDGVPVNERESEDVRGKVGVSSATVVAVGDAVQPRESSITSAEQATVMARKESLCIFYLPRI